MERTQKDQDYLAEGINRTLLILIVCVVGIMALGIASRSVNNYHLTSKISSVRDMPNMPHTNFSGNSKKEVDKLSKRMLVLHPTLSVYKAKEYGNLFYYFGKKHKVNPYLLAAIAFQESAYKLDAVSSEDFCMMQINNSNIEKLKLSTKRLVSEPAYCVETGAKILAYFKQAYSKEESDWWTRYNASNREARNTYKGHVQRHLNKLLKS
jgi:soluble lytic murein transglycosylase-like protein